MRNRLCQCVLLACAAFLSGCFTYYRGGDRPEAIGLAEDAWPVRDADVLRPLAEATAEYVQAMQESHADEADAERGGALHHYGAVDVRLTVGGLLRVFEDEQVEEDSVSRFLEQTVLGFERNASYISSRWFDRFGRAAIRDAQQTAAFLREVVQSTHPGATFPNPSALSVLLDEGLALCVPAQPGKRGLVVHLPALFGNSFERSVIRRLEKDGWAILHVQSDTHVRGPNELARGAAKGARDERRFEIMQNDLDNPMRIENGEVPNPSSWTKAQHEAYRRSVAKARKAVQAEIPMPETGFEVHPGDDLAAKAGLIAHAIDQHLADHAYAAQAAIKYIDDTLPAMADRPIVVIGFSAGSLAAPTVAARLRELYPERLAAVVLIGAGAPIIDIAHGSTLTDGGLTLTPDGAEPMTEATYAALRAQYLKQSHLDPWHTAAAVRDLPVLLIYAARDRIVPTSTASALRDRLGDPDRLVFPGGHMVMFYFLPSQQDRIARWLRRNVPRD